MQARSGVTQKPVLFIIDVQSIIVESVLIYCYLAGQCIAALAKTNYTLDPVQGLVRLGELKQLSSSCNDQQHSWQQMRPVSQTE